MSDYCLLPGSLHREMMIELSLPVSNAAWGGLGTKRNRQIGL